MDDLVVMPHDAWRKGYLFRRMTQFAEKCCALCALCALCVKSGNQDISDVGNLAARRPGVRQPASRESDSRCALRAGCVHARCTLLPAGHGHASTPKHRRPSAMRLTLARGRRYPAHQCRQQRARTPAAQSLRPSRPVAGGRRSLVMAAVKGDTAAREHDLAWR